MIVADTNIIAYCVIESEWTTRAVSLNKADSHWVVPRLWRSELCNLLATAMRNRVMKLEDAVLAFRYADTLIGDNEYNVDPARVLELAEASGCTAYDCEFVSLAEKLSVPLVTADKRLVSAFPDIAISLTNFASS